MILGRRDHASRYLSLADVLVLPSRNEGLPIVVLEALRSGVPVVGSDIPEIREALGPELDDFLFPPEDPQALASALRRALDITDRSEWTLRLHARFDCYTEPRMIAEYEDAYGSALRYAPKAINPTPSENPVS